MVIGLYAYHLGNVINMKIVYMSLNLNDDPLTPILLNTFPMYIDIAIIPIYDKNT